MDIKLALPALIFPMLFACGSSDSSNGAASDPKEFAPLCDDSGIVCNIDESALNMVGHYTGEGQTIQTTNQAWSVGNTSTFDARITEQSGRTVSGTFDMGSFHLDIESGQIRGTAQAFTIYGTDVQNRDNCSVEFQAVIVGSPGAAGSATVSGRLALGITNDITGSGCTADQKNGDPGTGAVFSYSATKVP